MRNLILLIVLLACLARYPSAIHKFVDAGSYVAKVIWILSEATVHTVNRFYTQEVEPKVEKAKSVNVMTP